MALPPPAPQAAREARVLPRWPRWAVAPPGCPVGSELQGARQCLPAGHGSSSLRAGTFLPQPREVPPWAGSHARLAGPDCASGLVPTVPFALLVTRQVSVARPPRGRGEEGPDPAFPLWAVASAGCRLRQCPSLGRARHFLGARQRLLCSGWPQAPGRGWALLPPSPQGTASDTTQPRTPRPGRAPRPTWGSSAPCTSRETGRARAVPQGSSRSRCTCPGRDGLLSPPVSPGGADEPLGTETDLERRSPGAQGGQSCPRPALWTRPPAPHGKDQVCCPTSSEPARDTGRGPMSPRRAPGVPQPAALAWGEAGLRAAGPHSCVARPGAGCPLLGLRGPREVPATSSCPLALALPSFQRPLLPPRLL